MLILLSLLCDGILNELYTIFVGALPRCFEEAGSHWGVAIAAEAKFLRRAEDIAARTAEKKMAAAAVLHSESRSSTTDAVRIY